MSRKRWHYQPIIKVYAGTAAFCRRTVVGPVTCRAKKLHDRLMVDTLSTTDPRKVTCWDCRQRLPRGAAFEAAVLNHEKQEASFERSRRRYQRSSLVR